MPKALAVSTDTNTEDFEEGDVLRAGPFLVQVLQNIEYLRAQLGSATDESGWLAQRFYGAPGDGLL